MNHRHLLGWLAILILTTGFQPGWPQAGNALVYANPDRLEIGAGQSEILQILLVNADKIYGIDMQATFDSAVVEIVDADSRQSGIQMLPGVFLKADFAVRNLADNKNGTLRYVVTQLNPTPPASGKGLILSIRFRGRKTGTHTKFTITSAVIADRRGIKQTVTTRGADLVIVKPKPSTPTPRPPSTLVPGLPTLLPATLTLVRSQPTALPGTTATWIDTPRPAGALAYQDNPPAQPEAITVQNNPARVPELDALVSDKLLTYVTAGGFLGALLLFVLTVWLLASKRRKERLAKVK